KYGGSWDLRPHRERLVRVNAMVLDRWAKLTGAGSAASAQLLYPVSNAEAEAIEALAEAKLRLGDDTLLISRGYDEANAKKDGLIQWDTSQSGALKDVILQGPHLSQGNPFAKQPNIPCKHNQD